MSDTTRFWTHGVSLVPQFSKAFTDTDNGLIMERADWGTKVTQNAGTSNWFHFPLTSASILDGEGAVIKAVSFGAEINNGAAIKRMHVTMIAQNLAPVKIIDQSIDITNQAKEFRFEIKKTISVGAIVLSLYTEFRTRSGHVIFKSANLEAAEF